MRIQKLNWAGIKISAHGRTILIDAVEDFSYYKPVIGEAMQETILFTADTAADYVLFTHLHIDHFDLHSILKCLKPDGKVIVYAELADKVKPLFKQHEVIILKLDEVFAEDDISFKPVFAMDGIGDMQSSWIVEAEGTKIFHGCDTIWHNQFWKLGKENKDIDYAFLPANGVVVHFPMIGLDYSPVPAALTLAQAFAAARLLGAEKLIPIHYGLFEHSKYYVPQKFTTEEADVLAASTKQGYVLLTDGAYLAPVQ